jgi:CBS domain-containing protein
MRPITAADVMNPVVLTVPDTLSVGELAAFLVQHEISGAPVCDEAGDLVGVVSVIDIAQAATERPPLSKPDYFARGWEPRVSPEELGRLRGEHGEHGERTVREIMTPTVYSVPEDTPVSEVAEIMIDRHIHRLLVTREEKVIGIVSTSDLLGLLVEEKA